MMDWKTRQKLYHLMTSYNSIGDSLLEQKVIEETEPQQVIQRALQYPHIQSEILYYPGKSFAVAIVYAVLLSHYFGGEIKDYLNDPELLYNNDPYFQVYENTKEIYDQILSEFPVDFTRNLNTYTPDFQRTVDYFMKEFLLHKETQIYANT